MAKYKGKGQFNLESLQKMGRALGWSTGGVNTSDSQGAPDRRVRVSHTPGKSGNMFAPGAGHVALGKNHPVINHFEHYEFGPSEVGTRGISTEAAPVKRTSGTTDQGPWRAKK